MAYFPYDSYRKGQIELIESIKSCLKDHQNIIVEAASGFGKTVSVLSAALEVAEKSNLSILYLCRTKREIDRVIEEAKKIQAKKYFTFSFLVSKADLCFLYSNQKLHAYAINILCKYSISNDLCGYWNSCQLLEPSVLSRLVSKIDNLSSYLLMTKKYHVCAYEVAKRSLFSSKLIVSTYGGLLQDPFYPSIDPSICDSSKTILILDEAHNLYDIISGLFSFEIDEKDIEDGIAEAYHLGLIDLARKIESLQPLYNKICYLVDKISAHDRAIIKSELNQYSLGEIALLQNLLAKYIKSTVTTSFLNTPYVVRSLAKIYLFMNYLLFYLQYQNILMLVEDRVGRNSLVFINVDPSVQIHAFLEKFRSYIMMSATVGSTKIYYSILKIDPTKTKFYYVEPQNLAQNVLVVVDKGITTKYKQRSQLMFDRIARRIYAITQSIPLNIGVFFSSYAMLSSIMPIFYSYNIDRPIFKESPNMTLNEASKLCEEYKSHKSEGAILFGVQGGRFSEGEDFQDGEMRAVIVVGLALPPPTKRLFLRMGYIKRTFSQNAFLVTMLDPAVKKAIQAAGRITRNSLPSIVFLLDSRFGSNLILEMLPKWMKTNLILGNLDESSFTRILNDSFPIFMSNFNR
ncbi:MAG: helicase C-terminal domain-containing protein [Nitrososphaeria archaeon]